MEKSKWNQHNERLNCRKWIQAIEWFTKHSSSVWWMIFAVAFAFICILLEAQHTFTSPNICYFISFQSVSILYKCIQFCMLLCGGYKGNHTIIYFSLMIVWAWEQGWKWTHMLLIAHPKPLKTQFNMMCVHLCAKLYGTFSVNI